nr:MAG TPA: hypothetical protein [Caudoviricetes sp.]
MIQYLIDVKLKDRNFKAYLYRENYLSDEEMEQEKIRFCKEIREIYNKAKSNIEILDVGIKVVD